MVQVGMHQATVLDFDIPLRHGLRQTIGDTLGIGGIFRALRTIPVMLGIAEDMRSGCPTHGSSTTRIRWRCSVAVYEGSPINRVVGLCHSVQHTTRRLAELVDVPFDEVTFLGAGINHQSFILRFERDGDDLYPLQTDVCPDIVDDEDPWRGLRRGRHLTPPGSRAPGRAALAR
jgi:alpha-galactosidase